MLTVSRIYKDENSNEVTVICDGESFHITVHDLNTLDLEEGTEIDDRTYDILVSSVERLSCIKKAFDFLSYGDLSEKQLRDKLCRKFPKELSADVAALFVERGYVNDNALAKRYAETYYEFKNLGIARIKNELYKRGFSKEDIEDAVYDYSELDQSERIEEFITKKYDMSRIDDVKYKQKVYAGAIRAGFSSADVVDVIRKFESE
ncbi:MAG: RecX family transcriptional regulator [Clostridia bacterium]|jgi:regulatory protein|nr:RecX family transcriptional regulator [Clostridia bacterium]